MGMTLADVKNWALARGFFWQGEGDALAAPFKTGFVLIEPLKRNVRMSILARVDGTAMVQRSSTVHPSRLFVNEHGMLEGLGLSSSLVMSMKDESEIPAWYPPAYADEVRRVIGLKREVDTDTVEAGDAPAP